MAFRQVARGFSEKLESGVVRHSGSNVLIFGTKDLRQRTKEPKCEVRSPKCEVGVSTKGVLFVLALGCGFST